MDTKRSFKTPECTAVIAALVSGTITHLFGLVNVLHNYDDIAQQPRGYGTGVTSGRWLLSLLGDFCDLVGGNYNLTFVNGLLFIALIACSAGFLVSVFHIGSRKMAALVGMLLVAFPSAFSTLAFRYTAVYYGMAMLLSVLAAWILQRHKYGLFLSALCTAFALGIYQAYVPMTIGIFVLMLLQQTLEGNSAFWKLIRRGIYYCISLLLGLLFYYLFLEITLKIYGTELSTYQGVNQMGKIALADLPELVREALYSVCMLPLKDYCGLAASKLIKIAYLLLFIFDALIIGYILFRKIKKISLIFFTAVLCLAFPIAVNFIVIMCPDSWVYTLMVYSFVLVACAPIILFECIGLKEDGKQGRRRFLAQGISFVLAMLIGSYAYQTNVNYIALYYSNRQVENYLNSLVVQVRMAEGFDTEMDWAFIGEIDDPLLHCYWQYEMNYGGIEFTEWMLQRYSWGEWIRNYFGYTFPVESDNEIAELNKSDEVRNMPCWPNEGSIKVIDDTVVIKCQDLP